MQHEMIEDELQSFWRHDESKQKFKYMLDN